MSRFQNHQRRFAGVIRLYPTGGAETPSITGAQAGKTELRTRRTEIVASRFREHKKLVGHYGTNRMAAKVFSASLAVAVPGPTRHWLATAFLKIPAHYVPHTVLILAALCAAPSYAAQPGLMPWPSTYRAAAGELPITTGFSVSIANTNAQLDGAAKRLTTEISRETGMPFLLADTAKPTITVRYESADGDDESYKLSVTSTGALLTAQSAVGILRGFATVAQLVTASGTGFALPAVEIEDHPRFGWRGLMIDSARHFFSVDAIKRNLDGMASVKLNVFHWHLADNQGFRVESKVYPKLQGQGSDGLFYTQEQVRDVIQYAADRGIRVVPEFDIPGHTTAWLVGYPELAAGAGPFEIGRTWGIFDPAMDPTADWTYTFLDNLIGEMAALFPDPYFHIGGDEVNGRQWNTNERITAFKRSHGMLGPGTPTKAQQTASNEKLQAYFNSRIEPIVRKHGKKMMGWDEILSPELPKTIVIQSWRGQKSLGEAVRQGFSGLLSSGYYLDLAQPARQHYLIDPLIDPKTSQAISLTADEQARILGGEACMWSEYVTEETLDSRIWPRTAAIAERFWSPATTRDLDSMYSRLEIVNRKLDFLGLHQNSNYGPMLERIAPGSDLRTLADVVEPVKGYGRSGSGHKYTQQTPLNRLVDAARPESTLSRHFAQSVAAKDWTVVRAQLTVWQNYRLPDSPSVQEAAPVAKNLNRLGAIGLQALDCQLKEQLPPAAWAAELTAMKKPHAELLLSPVDAVLTLVGKLP